MPEKQPLILTLAIDVHSQQFFDRQRARYFPAERNYLNAHLTLFHQLPQHAGASAYLTGLQIAAFEAAVTGLIKLGGGVAYRIESAELQQLHQVLKQQFHPYLIPQDLQPFRPHITIQNKVTPPQANLLFDELLKDFEPFTITATGLQLWTYLNGPWQHEQTIWWQ